MEQSSSVFVQTGSISGDSASCPENTSILPTSGTSDLRRERLQIWFDHQAPLRAANHPEELAITRHEARASAAINIFNKIFNSHGESESRKIGKAIKHHPRTVETTPAQPKKIVAPHIPNGLEAKGYSIMGGFASDPSTVVSKSKDTVKCAQGGQSATDPIREFRGISMSSLYEMQEGMIKNIMTKFWARFGDWMPKTTCYADKSTTSQSTSNGFEGHGMSFTRTVRNRRARNSDGSFKGGNGAKKPYDRPSKYPRKSGDTSKDRDRTLDFACPFKKRHPCRYNLDEHRSCTIGHWPSIALMKQHLTRRHKPLIQCQRCWICFQSQSALHSHSRLSTPCQVLEHNPVPGMTVEIESWLKTEKRPGQSEVDRWNAIYEKLFPGSPIPSPYFDPLIDFHNFERAEVPRIFEESIRALVAEEMLPLEERIIERMGELVRSSQERALLAYRAIYSLETEAEPQEDSITPLPQSLSYSYSHNSEPREESNGGHFPDSNDALICGCHGLCTCLGNLYESATLAQPTFAQDFALVDTSGNSIDGDNTTSIAMQEPGSTSPNENEEGETFEWSSWMNG